MSSSKRGRPKRKYEDDIACRGFHAAWEEQFFFVEGKCEKRRPICLLCGATVAVPKKYNLERHFRQNHKGIDETYPIGSQLRSYVIATKKLSLQMQQSLGRQTYELKSLTVASYEIALLLARKKKPYSDGEDVIKESLIIAAKNLGDQELQEKFSQIVLTQKSIQEKIDAMAVDVSLQLQLHVTSCTYFSLAVCETTDMRETSQLCVFIRCINNDFQIIDELLSTNPRHLIFTGDAIFDKVKASLDDFKLDMEKLECICTDGAPAMIDSATGFIARTENFLKRDVFKFHCIIHLDTICKEALGYDEMAKVVLRCINKIRAKALSHPLFRKCMEELEESGDFHSDMRWLLRGKTIHLFYKLRTKIIKFLNSENEMLDECACLKNGKWLNDIAFLADILDHLNHLNSQLQGKGYLYPRLVNVVNAFIMKLTLFSKQLEKGSLDHFEHLKDRQNLLKPNVKLEQSTSKKQSTDLCTDSNETEENGKEISDNDKGEIDFQRYKEKILLLKENFEKRFQELNKDKNDIDINLFLNPFSISEDHLFLISSDMQMEVIELKSNIYLMGLYRDNCATIDDSGENLISFWSMLPQSQFPNLRKFAQRYICRFGTTYGFEQTFSWMKMKSKQCLHQTDEHFENLVRLGITNLEPRINEIVERQQHGSM